MTVRMPVKRSLFRLHNCDIRKLPELLSSNGYNRKFIDVTITSPPYFDLISYGYENQIGHGQEYCQYLNDLKEIFRQIYLVTKETGSLWIVVDAFNKNGNFINLPFDISETVENLFETKPDKSFQKRGWKLTDLVIWKKDKTLPWSRKGQFRNIFEYILFFTKTNKFKFHVDKIRIFDTSKLKEWWVDFPERYNPKGTVPTNVWEYPIPTQGVWTHRSLRHFNPLPPNLIERILLLTTNPNDVVFDPFAGSGTVLSVADFWNRKWLGFEMNPQYCEMFGRVMNETKRELLLQKKRSDQIETLRKRFEGTIKNLRMVKFPKSLMRELVRRGVFDSPSHLVGTIFAISTRERKNKKESSILSKHKLLTEDVYLIMKNQTQPDFLRKQISAVVTKPPLSKFGIESRVFLQSPDEFVSNQRKTLENMNLWLYAFGVVRKFERSITFSDWISEMEKPHWEDYTKNAVPPIISNVGVSQEVPKMWQSKEKKHLVQIDRCKELLR